MNKIKFQPSHYYNNETMSPESEVLDNEWKLVEYICNSLNDKYKIEKGCTIHPDRKQIIQLGLFNKFVDIQIQKSDTCCCHDIVEKLINIRNTELLLLNLEYFKERQA